ncbi:MAG: response regulator [Candidatus Zambryskibacteria bacterium]|nr:response regulator [Candidatus Zambryskibacteria bacterium]
MTQENKTLKIIIVDDDKFLLDMYSMKFKKSGLEITTAFNGVSALEKLRSIGNFDIILLDIIMPSMDGLELLKIIRDEKLVPNAVIIMLTNQADDFEKVKSYNIDGYIIKATTIPSEVVGQVLLVYKNKSSH